MKVLKLGKKMLAIAAVSFVAVLLVAPGTIAAQSTAGSLPPIPPDVPPGLNVLPSTVKGATSALAGAGRLEVEAALLYKFSQTPGFWQAIAAHQAGTATAGQVELIESTKAGYAVPATRLGGLIRGVGVGATAISGYSVGTMIGNQVTGVLGIDAAGVVCAATSGVGQIVTGLLTGVDCEDFNEFHEGYVVNSDVVPGWYSGTSCYGSMCATVVAKVTETLGSTVNGWCLAVTDPSPPSGSIGLFVAVSSNPAVFGSTGATPEADIRSLPWYQSGSWLDEKCDAAAPGAWNYGHPAVDDAADPAVGWQIGSLAATVAEPAEASANPERTLLCVITGTDSEVYEASTEPYTEEDGFLPQPNCPELPEGVWAGLVQIYEVVDGDESLLYEQEVTPEFGDATTLAPECMDGTCLLDLRKEGVGSCFQSPESCAGWFADPNKESTYSCFYGTHAVDLAECTVYAPTFDPDAVTTGNVYGDPETGQPVGAPAGASPGSDARTFGQSVGDPATDRQCFPTGWGVLNPVEWVFRPVACALEWAFVPRPAVVQAVGVEVSTAWSETALAQPGQIVNGWAAGLPTGTGGSCLGPEVSLDDPALDPYGFEGTYYPMQACDEPMATIAAITKVVISGAVILGGAFAIVRYLAATFGYVGVGKEGAPS